MVSIGLGALIISVLNITRNSLLAASRVYGQRKPIEHNSLDIQPHQRDGVVKLMNDHQFKPNQVVPIITCPVERSERAYTVATIQKDTAAHIRIGRSRANTGCNVSRHHYAFKELKERYNPIY